MRSVLLGGVTGWILARSGLASNEAVLAALTLHDGLAAFVGLGALVAAALIGPAHRARSWPYVLLGLGLGVTGALPVTTFVQVGAGRGVGLIVLAGVLVGAWLGRRSEADVNYSRDK